MEVNEILFQKYGRTFKPGEMIFSEWEPGRSLFIILKGKVKIIKIFGKTQKTLDVVEEGSIFGEMALLEEEPRSASAIAITEVKALEFDKESFEVLIQKQPQLVFNLLVLFAKRIYDAKRRLKNLLIEDPTVRVIDVFLMLTENEPIALQKNSISLHVTIDDVANWSGLPMSEVNSIVMSLVKQGKIELYADKIVIPNLRELQRFVQTKVKSFRKK
ncbi:MAG: Crp/Fnr family transcriptional regulator [Leptospiraceae bacterium]|nr:Crp/Fnr family transcriptional regulator [Leptospiraceae bacterium]MDW7976095.1 Crp/Fnr family transcriptional regulator [Leptospiraceae bacterium]